MGDKGTEISIGKDGFSFKTDGEASERLANAALDFLSPITEGVGFLGTKLRGYRMEAALKSTVRAKQICEEYNLPINPVPPKFMLQWAEGASLEDLENKQNLSELWANLLVTTSNKGDQSSKFFIDILKKISGAHAQLLTKIIQGKPCSQWEMISEEMRPIELRRTIRGIGSESPNHPTVISDKNVPAFVKDKINPVLNQPGSAVIRCNVTTKDDFLPRPSIEMLSCIEEKFHTYDDTLNTLYDLDALNLVNIIEISDFDFLGYVFYIEYVCLSEFGIQFLYACMPDEESIFFGV